MINFINIKKTFQILFFFISILVFYFLLNEIDLSSIKYLSFYSFLILSLIRIINFSIFQLSSYYLYRAFNEDISILDLSLINSCSTVSNYATPVKIGFPLQAFLMKKMLNIPYKKSTVIIFTNLLIGLSVTVFLTLLFIVFFPNDLHFNMLSKELIIKFLIVVLFIATILFMIFYSRFLNHNKIILLKNKIVELKDYFLKINFLYLFASILFAFSSFFINAFMIKVILNEIGESMNISLLFLIQGLPYILGMISMVPLGLGVKDISLTYLLIQIGVNSELAVISSIIIRIFNTGFSIFAGLFSFNYMINRKIFSIEDISEVKND